MGLLIANIGNNKRILGTSFDCLEQKRCFSQSTKLPLQSPIIKAQVPLQRGPTLNDLAPSGKMACQLQNSQIPHHGVPIGPRFRSGQTSAKTIGDKEPLVNVVANARYVEVGLRRQLRLITECQGTLCWNERQRLSSKVSLCRSGVISEERLPQGRLPSTFRPGRSRRVSSGPEPINGT